MIVVRLKRISYKKHLHYHLIVSMNKRAPVSNKYIEKLGNYYAIVDKWSNKFILVNIDRLFFWLTRGVRFNRSIFILLQPLLFFRGIINFKKI